MSHEQLTLAPIERKVECDRNSDISLSRALSQYASSGDLEGLASDFLEWSRVPMFMIFRSRTTGALKIVPSARRGNKAYAHRVRSRLRDLRTRLLSMERYCGKSRTRTLFFTLTYRRDVSLQEAWMRVAKDWNIFTTRLRKEFGKVSYVRVFEAHCDAYPHVHAVLFFHDRDFGIQGKRGRYRLVRYPSFFKELWPHGFSDISGVEVLLRLMNYIFGTYFGKGHLATEQNALGLAMMWIHRKRVFSVSRDLDRLDRETIIQTEESEWMLLGFVVLPVEHQNHTFVSVEWYYDDELERDRVVLVWIE